MLRRTFLKLSLCLTAFARFFAPAKADEAGSDFFTVCYWALKRNGSWQFHSSHLSGSPPHQLDLKETVTNLAIWDIHLPDEDIRILSRGASPTNVRPDRLKLLYPMHRAQDKPLQINYSSPKVAGSRTGV